MSSMLGEAFQEIIKTKSKEERMLNNIKENEFIDQEDIDNIIAESGKTSRI